MKLLLLFALAARGLQASDALFAAARQGDLAKVKTEVESGVPVDAKWRYDQTALFIAAGRGHAEIARYLIERGADVNAKDSFYGMTVLSAAAQKDNVPLLLMLLDRGAKGGDEVLAALAGEGKSASVQALLARPGWTAEALSKALAAAEGRKRPEVAEMLKASGAKPKPEVQVDPAVLGRYRGKYAGEGLEFTVDVAGNRLRVSGPGPVQEWRPLDESTFEPVQYPGMLKLEFQMDAGRAVGMNIQQGATVTKLRRVGEAPQ